MKTVRRNAALVGTVLLLALGSAPSYASEPASAQQTCYGQAFPYQSWPGGDGYSYTDWNQVLGACDDINIRTNHSRYVQVCGTTWCGDWKAAYEGKWTVIHWNSDQDAWYYVRFRGENSSTGLIAD